MEKINLQDYRKNGSKIFSGRDLGIQARQQLGLNQKDCDNEQYLVIIPHDTYSISGSFFGGLFSDSVIHLNEEKFKAKYIFKCSQGELSEVLQSDIEEGIYDAINCL